MEPTGMQTLAAAMNLTPGQLVALVSIGGVLLAVLAVVAGVVMVRTPTPEDWPADPRPTPPRAAGPSSRRVS